MDKTKVPKEWLEVADKACDEYWEQSAKGEKSFKKTGVPYSSLNIAEMIALRLFERFGIKPTPKETRRDE